MAHTLVPSDRVETASVYGRDDKKIGTIERLMLEKRSGTIAYAVVRCGGLLKGEVRHYPVPWDSLKYNVARKAHTTNVTLEELRSGPSELEVKRSTGATAPRFIAIRNIGRCSLPVESALSSSRPANVRFWGAKSTLPLLTNLDLGRIRGTGVSAAELARARGRDDRMNGGMSASGRPRLECPLSA